MSERVIDLFVSGVPVAQPRTSIDPRPGRSAAVAVPGTKGANPAATGRRVRAFVPRDHPVHVWKMAIRLAVGSAWASGPLDGPVRVSLLFVMPRPKYMGEGPRAWHLATPDADNLEKAVLDAVKGLLFGDDRQVCSVMVDKVYAASAEPPGVHVVVAVPMCCP